MGLYRYKAIAANGEIETGEARGKNREEIINQLHDKGFLPISAEETGKETSHSSSKISRWQMAFGGNILNGAQLTVMTRELSNMIGAGVTLERSLEILLDITERPEMKGIIENILSSVRAGKLFSEALQEQGFDALYVGLVRAGETGGALGEVLNSLADYFSRMQALRSSVITALAYPAILLCVSVGALVLLLIFVIPEFEQMFMGMEDKIPLATRIVIDASGWLQGNWLISLVLVGLAAFGFSRLSRLQRVAYRLDQLWLGLPVVGSIIRKVEAARMCRTLGTLLKNGVPMLTALHNVQDILKNRVLGGIISRIPSRIQAGESLSAPLIEADEFPRLAVHMIRVGEETGRLNRILMDIAHIYDQEVERSIKRFLGLLEPLLILFFGILIGGIIISVLVGIFSINDLAI